MKVVWQKDKSPINEMTAGGQVATPQFRGPLRPGAGPGRKAAPLVTAAKKAAPPMGRVARRAGMVTNPMKKKGK